MMHNSHLLLLRHTDQLALKVDGHRCLSPLIYIKLRHIRDMAETLLIVRDGNGNCNSSPMFLFSVWCHLRIPCASKNMYASCRRKSNNGKRTGKCTQPIRSCGARGQSVVHSWTLTAGNIQVVCNTNFHLSSLSFLRLALLQDSFYRCFLIMHHCSNVASQLMLSEFLFLRYIAQIIIFLATHNQIA